MTHEHMQNTNLFVDFLLTALRASKLDLLAVKWHTDPEYLRLVLGITVGRCVQLAPAYCLDSTNLVLGANGRLPPSIFRSIFIPSLSVKSLYST